MKCIILTAGHSSVLESDILADKSGAFTHLNNKPKALLPGPDGRPILDNWWEALTTTRQRWSDIFLVTNAEKYKHFERWATAQGFPRENIINDGTTLGTGGIGALADFDLALRSRGIEEDVLVVAGDMLFDPKSFDLDGVLRYFNSCGGELSCYYPMSKDESTATRGILELSDTAAGGGRIMRFLEKPAPTETISRKAGVVLVCLRAATLPKVGEYLSANTSPAVRSFGLFLAWLVPLTPCFGMKLPECFSLIGSHITLREYQRAIAAGGRRCGGSAQGDGLDSSGSGSGSGGVGAGVGGGNGAGKQSDTAAPPTTRIVTRRAYARVGLMGNPSDGFFGKTISLSIANYWAQAQIKPSARLVLTPHPLNDPSEFGSLADLYGISRQEGYQGGLRLMQATCKKFFEYCGSHGIAVARRNFTLSYDTNIPRQVGLAGSSAIVTACLKCLMFFFELTESDIPKTLQPSLVLAIEREELGINAGLQDRVIQIYDGCVYMDFEKSGMEKRGHGNYIALPMRNPDLPAFWLAYLADPSDSGKIHSNVRARYDAGDVEVVDAMAEFARFAEEARGCIEAGNAAELANLMDANFALRRKVYGDACVGSANLAMVEIAQRHGAAVKFPGSGGAVVGLCREPGQLAPLKADLERAGFVFSPIVPHAPESQEEEEEDGER
eukprot:UC1_evm5s2186